MRFFRSCPKMRIMYSENNILVPCLKLQVGQCLKSAELVHLQFGCKQRYCTHTCSLRSWWCSSFNWDIVGQLPSLWHFHFLSVPSGGIQILKFINTARKFFFFLFQFDYDFFLFHLSIPYGNDLTSIKEQLKLLQMFLRLFEKTQTNDWYL